MSSVELRAADAFTHAELATIFTAGFAEYVVPIQLDEPAFARMVEVADVDLARSVVAVRGGAPVGIGLLAVRGERGWVAGLGVAVEARRSGVGRRVMEALTASAAGLDLTLEVIESNAAALALYEGLGFRETRKLELWTLEADAPPSRATPAGVDEAHTIVLRHRRSPEPWQRADETLAHLRRRGDVSDALVVDEDGAAVYTTGARAGIVQLAARDESVAAELIAGVRARAETVSFFNVPEGDPASAALRALGARLELRQLELAPSR